MTRPLAPIIVAVLAVAAASVAVGATEGGPSFSVYLPDNHVAPGEDATLEVVLLNARNVTSGGPQSEEATVNTARNVVVSLGSGDAPIEVRTADRPMGTVPEGRSGPVPFTVSVAESAPPGRYALPVTIRYNYTAEIDRGESEDPIRTSVTRPVTVVVDERARFAAVNASTDAFVGGSGDVTLRFENVGSAAATDARIELRSADPALTFGGAPTAQVFVGDWAPGERRAVTVSGRFAAGAGLRPIPVVSTVTFEDDDGRTHRSDPLQAGVTPVAGPSRFPVVDATADVAVAESGTVELTLRNAGDTAVSAATVTVRSADPAVTFGGGPTASVFVGNWAPGANRTVSLSVRVAAGADVRSYPLSASVEYRSPSGETRQSAADSAGVTPRPEQTFTLADVTSTLAVGDEGTVEGTLTNTGTASVRNAVVVFAAESANVAPVETEYAVGDLGPGASASFAFDAEVADAADAGPRQLSFVIRYRDGGDDVRRTDPLDARVAVGARTDRFQVERVTGDLGAGTTGVLELRVTNAGETPVTSVSAKLFADDPLSSSDDEAFIDRLRPGESRTVRFSLTAAPDAQGKVYPASLDFQYDDAEGDTRLSDTYDVPVRVTVSTGSGAPPVAVLVGGAGAVVALAGGVLFWRRR